MFKTVLSLSQGKTFNRVLFATISKSIFGQLNVNGIFSVDVSESNLDGSDGFGKALMNIKRCSLNIIDSNISNYSTNFGPAVLRSTESHVKISNTKFRQNIDKNGLIEILNNSRLELEHSLFENNGIGSGYNISHASLISINVNSLASVENCTFVENKGRNGACMQCDESSKLLVRDSSFVNNTGSLGGAIYCGVTDMTKGYKDYCCYGNNTKMFKPNGDGKCRSGCDFKNCTFRNNIAYEGKSLYVRSSSINIYNCSFEQTIPKYGGLVYGIQHSNITIDRTSFLSYTKKSLNATQILIRMEKYNPVVAVAVTDHCTLNILDSQFVGGSFMEVQNYSTATIDDSSFRGHDQILGGLSFVNHATGNFHNCILSNNSGILILLKNHAVVTMETCDIVDNVLEFLDDLIHLENRCHFNLLACNISRNNLFRIMSIVRSSAGSTVFSENCNCLNNSATNFLTITEGNTTVIGCTFIGNKMHDALSSFFDQHTGVIYVERSVFRQNNAGIGNFRNVRVKFKDSFMEQEAPAIYHTYSYNSNITIFNCTIVCKPAILGIMVTSDGGDILNYLAIKKSHIRCSGRRTNQISHLADVDIQNSSLLFKGHNPGWNITAVLNVRIAYSEFYSDEEATVAIGFYTGYLHEFGKTNFYTYNAKFRRKQFSTWSNNTRFFKAVKTQGLIKVGNDAFVSQEETVYASGKY